MSLTKALPSLHVPENLCFPDVLPISKSRRSQIVEIQWDDRLAREHIFPLRRANVLLRAQNKLTFRLDPQTTRTILLHADHTHHAIKAACSKGLGVHREVELLEKMLHVLVQTARLRSGLGRGLCCDVAAPTAAREMPGTRKRVLRARRA